MYLSCNSRPDIAFALHQCACSMHDPQKPHLQVVKQIVCYLKGVADKRIIFSTVDKASMDSYVDADFAGAFNKEGDMQDPSTARSHTGYIVFTYGVPICWGSKLQTKVTLSMMEAEYIALATATREVLGLCNLLEESQMRGMLPRPLNSLLYPRSLRTTMEPWPWQSPPH
jgi:hypothetical protein